MKFKLINLVVFALLTSFVTGCATLTKPQMAEVRLNSYPQNVQVLVNGYDRGITPLILNVERKKKHNITFMVRGQQPIHVQIKPKLDLATTILGNLVSWNVIGVVVDLVTGHAYTLSPADIEQNFESISKTMKIDSSDNKIGVLLITKSDWDQITAKQTPIISN